MTQISCVLPTMPSRARFAAQAVRYFLRQTWPEKELVVVDDPPGRPEGFEGLPGVRYFVKEGLATVGAKMNFGIEQSRGDVLHKQDDDDWYHPELLADLWALMKDDPEGTMPRVSGAPFLLVRPWRLVTSPEKDWVLGGSILFHRKTWERRAFREDFPSGSDYQFRRDALPIREPLLRRDDRFAHVRHGLKHTWTEDQGRSLDELVAGYPNHPLTPEAYLGADAAFYRALRGELLGPYCPVV